MRGFLGCNITRSWRSLVSDRLSWEFNTGTEVVVHWDSIDLHRRLGESRVYCFSVQYEWMSANN